MPSKKNPSEIKVGAGLAGRGSISTTSLIAGGSGDFPTASEVAQETPLALSGDNVQQHINQAALRAHSPLPNRVGETSNALNTGIVDTSPASVLGFSAGAVARDLYPSTSVVIQGVFFPADRGILVLEADGVEVAALDLEAVFVEGDPEDTAPPTRGISQLDYTAGDDASGTLGALPQFSLSDRLPVLADYSGVYEDYPEDFGAQQIATFQVTTPQTDLTVVSYEVVHYRSLAEYAVQGRKFGSSLVPAAASRIFVDNGSVTPVIASFSMDAASPTGSVDLSGVTLYDSGTAVITPTFSVANMFDNTFLFQGIKVRMQAGSDVNPALLSYTQYDAGNPNPGQAANFASPLVFPDVKCTEIDPELVAMTPYGVNVTLASSTPEILLVHAGGVDAQLTTREIFLNETARFASDSNIMEPDGTGSLWNSSTALLAGEAQVRPARVGADLSLVLGGELGYPLTNYSVGYKPTGNPDYSGTTGSVIWYRAFDMGSSRKTGSFRIVGKNVAANLFEDMKFDPTQNTPAESYGHASRILIQLSAEPNPNGDLTQDLGKEYGLGGSLVNVVVESNSSIVLDFQLDQNVAQSPQGFFPVFMSVTWNATTQISLYSITLLPES